VLAVAVALAGCQKIHTEPGTPLAAEVQRKPWQTPYSRGEELRSPTYRIFITTRRPELRHYLPGFMEAVNKHYLQLTALPPLPKTKLLELYVLGTRKEWMALTRHRFGGRNRTASQIGAGGYCVDGVCVLWDIRVKPTLSVAAHEGLHQFFFYRLKDPLPMWVEEGLCVLAEGFELYDGTVRFTPGDNASRFNALRQGIIQDHWLDLETLLPMHSTDAISDYTEKSVAFYGQLWSLILYIRQQPEYLAGLHRLLNDAMAGRIQAASGLSAGEFQRLRRRPLEYTHSVSLPLFRHYITDDLETFEKDWLRFSEKLTAIPN